MYFDNGKFKNYDVRNYLKDTYDNPFIRQKEKQVFAAIETVVDYCNLVRCQYCQIKYIMHCDGQCGRADSPFYWCDTPGLKRDIPQERKKGYFEDEGI